jgi:hypothetical protein
MKAILSGQKTIITQPAVTKTISEINVMYMIDNPMDKKLTVVTKELGQVVVFEGQSYINIGQWTDLDVIDRLLVMYNV